jgi:hypothetical protein
VLSEARLTDTLLDAETCCAGVVAGGAFLYASSEPESFALATIVYAAARILICAYTYFHSSAISCVDRPVGTVSMTVRPSIIEAA